MKTIVLKVRNLPNKVDTDLFVYCMQQDVVTSYPKGKVELVPEIVRCKDCRKNMMCEMTIHKPRNWFCADGEV